MTRGHDSYHRGWRAEWAALAFLMFKGYWPRALRYRTRSQGGGEIDLIAQRGNLLAAVEVKARPTLITGHESMNEAEWRRRKTAMDDFMRRRIRGKNFSIRFDLVIVTPYFQIEHVEAAWQPGF